ncbi:MAG: hypothetical protein ACI4PR_03545 [Acutalibacteraceae bacterium]
MKSKWHIFFMVWCMMFVFLLSGSSVKANETLSDLCLDSEGVLSHCKFLRNDIICTEKYDYSPEIKRIKIHDLTVYRKKITVTREYMKVQNSEASLIASGSYEVSFTYDKKSAVKVDINGNDSVKSSGMLKFLLEKFCDDNLALLSTKYVVYEKSPTNEYKYLMDGHTDISCTINGEILINSDVH